MRVGLRKRVFRLAGKILSKPVKSYQQKVPNNLANLRQYIRKGDVVLVEGDQRVSEVIKYLTQSTWSHAALYVGDELLQRFPEKREQLLAEFGEDARHILIEALMEGVVASPLSKYATFTLRICRPRNLRREDLKRVLDEVIGQIGHQYDLQNVFDLARYFFPVNLVRRRFRRRRTRLGSGLPTEVICSSMIARAYQNVGFPVLPRVSPEDEPPRRRRLRDSLLFFRRSRTYGTYRRREPALITPRDFDLSPYFEILKFNVIEDLEFDYRKIRWADSTDEEPPASAARRA